MSHRRVDGRGRYGKEYGNSLVRRETRRTGGLQARVRVKITLTLPPPPLLGLALAHILK